MVGARGDQGSKHIDPVLTCKKLPYIELPERATIDKDRPKSRWVTLKTDDLISFALLDDLRA